MPAIVLAFLQGTHFALHHATRISAMVSLILFLLSAFLLLSLSEAFQYPAFLSFLLLRLAILIPGILWLLAYYLFSDEARWLVACGDNSSSGARYWWGIVVNWQPLQLRRCFTIGRPVVPALRS